MKIRFLGAARQVTGSCYHLSVNGMQFLVDCGMQQGENAENGRPFAFQPSEIACLFLTHAHIDHSGLIPKLVKEGFRGQIIATGATAALVEDHAPRLGPHTGKGGRMEDEEGPEAGERPHLRAPLHSGGRGGGRCRFSWRRSTVRRAVLGKGLRYCFIDAGHILGSSTFALWYQDSPVEKKIVFSGDIGNKGNPIIADPRAVRRPRTMW